VLIDSSADVHYAVTSIIDSKTFDNGTICASEQSVICESSMTDAVVSEFERQGGYFLNDDEIKKIETIAFNREKGIMSADVVGQSVEKIAGMAGIGPLPEGTKLLIARQEHVGKAFPLSQEILAPILAFYESPGFESAVKRCIDLNYLGGIGHTVCIYANDEKRIMEFSNVMNAGRILVNTPSIHGAIGGVYNILPTSLTLGCGTGGKNITTENITAHHLINVQRVCRRHENTQWLNFDKTLFFDESLKLPEILKEYQKNY
jgi:acetaldehyde dehydrogenase/alcohol dehydrogenase